MRGRVHRSTAPTIRAARETFSLPLPQLNLPKPAMDVLVLVLFLCAFAVLAVGVMMVFVWML